MKLLLFGGAFDPVHRGHLALLKAAWGALRPGRLLLIPTGNPPHKAAPAAPWKDRAALLRRAMRKLPAALRERASVSALEAKGGPHYTVRTVERVAKENPRAELWLLLGTDQLASFGTWKRAARIRKLAKLAAGRRPEGGKGPVKPDLWLPGTFPEASSSELRQRLAAGGKGGRDLPHGVEPELRKRGLYGTGWHRRLRESLSPGRYRHTLAVARLAGRVAERHGADPWKAQQAALLHDCGRVYSIPAMARYARRRRLAVPALAETVERAPLLVHAHVGADLAKRRFGVSDPEVLRAIERHTLGDERMGLLDKVLYASDAGSEDRTFDGSATIRRLAFKDLDAAVRKAHAAKLKWVKAGGGWIHPTGARMARSLGLEVP